MNVTFALPPGMSLTFVFPPEARVRTKAGDIISIDGRLAFEVVLIHSDGRVDVTVPHLRRFEVGEEICGLTLQTTASCPHCAELRAQPPGPASKVVAVDQDTGTVTFDADHPVRP